MTTTVSYQLLQIAPEFTTNTHLAGDQLAPDVLGLSGGGFVSAYNNGDVTGGAVFIDFYDKNHEVIGTAQAPNATPPGTLAAGQPSLTELNNGNVLVAWDENMNSDNGAGIRGRIYTAAGVPVSGELALSELSFVETANVHVAALDNGGFAVAYNGWDDAGVVTRVYDKKGELVQGTTPVDVVVTCEDGQIAGLAGGGYAITWTDNSGAQSEIHARVFDDEGGSQTDVIAVGVGGQNTQSSVAALANGNFAVVYADTGWGGAENASSGITLQIVGIDGTVLTPGGVHVNTPTSVSETAPDVTVLANGFIAVSWTVPSRQHGDDIFARLFDANGAAISVGGSTGPLAITTSPGQDSASAISAMLGGDFITSWQDSDAVDGSGGQITSKIEALVRVTVGDDAGDLFIGDLLRDSVDGNGGDDTLYGFGGADTMNGGAGVDVLGGHQGRDVLEGGAGSDSVDGNEGNDILYGAAKGDAGSATDHDVITGDEGNDILYGSAGGDTVDGGDGDDRAYAGAGDDLLFGGNGDDKLDAGAGDDSVEGNAGSDTIKGGDGNDVIYANRAVDSTGSPGGDIIYGGDGDDSILGASTADTLDGGKGDDLIIGDMGADQLTGGGGIDTFRFTNANQSPTATPDVILDLQTKDWIDLSPMDADLSQANNQAFVQVAQFSHTAGELVVQYQTSGAFLGYTTIQGDQDGDGVADFTILAAGDQHAFSHFIL